MKKRFLIFAGLCLIPIAVLLIAAKPDGITHLTSLWIGDRTDTAGVTPGDNDLFVSGTAEVDGIIYADGGISDVTGGVTSTEIADITRSIHIDLLSAWLEGTGMLGNDGITAPGVSTAATDGIPKVVYATSAETASVGWTIFIPADYSTGLAFRVMTSSSLGTTSGFGLSWELWVNKNLTTFDAAAYAQTSVGSAQTTTAALDVSNEVLTLTADATALAGIAAGDAVTILIGNADTRAAAGTTEICAIEARYTAVQ